MEENQRNLGFFFYVLNDSIHTERFAFFRIFKIRIDKTHSLMRGREKEGVGRENILLRQCFFFSVDMQIYSTSSSLSFGLELSSTFISNGDR